MTDPNQPHPEQPPSYGQEPGFGQPPAYGQSGVGEPSGFAPPPPGPQYGYPPAPPAPQAPVPTGPGGLVLDQASGLYIPAGTELASVGRRIGAYFLSILLFIVTLGIGYIIWGAIVWSQGTSPALKVLGMKVWRIDNGTVPGWGRMALRDIVGRFVEGLLGAITELVSFILFASTAKRQALHDLIASTTVLYDPNKVLG